MVNYREILRLNSLGHSNSFVASSCGSSRNTVSKVLRLAKEKDIGWPIPDELTNRDLEQLLYPDRRSSAERKMPDFEYMHRELARPSVTLSLLWAEYGASCEQEHAIPYQHTQFYEKYRAYIGTKKATLHIKRKPGELMEVDWAGDTLSVYDGHNTEPIKAYIFVACLPCSLYSYAEAFPDMKSESWTNHRCLRFPHADISVKAIMSS